MCVGKAGFLGSIDARRGHDASRGRSSEDGDVQDVGSGCTIGARNGIPDFAGIEGR